MKRTVAFLFGAILAQVSVAQTTFSFSGLAWGDTIDVVDTKLRAAGFSGCTLKEKVLCKAAGRCSCEFDGPGLFGAGAALFDGPRLDRVEVHVFPDDRAGTLRTLVGKYGPPLPRRQAKQVRSNAGIFELLDSADLADRWQSTYGETLTFEEGFLSYTSGAFYRRQEERKRTEASKF